MLVVYIITSPQRKIDSQREWNAEHKSRQHWVFSSVINHLVGINHTLIYAFN